MEAKKRIFRAIAFAKEKVSAVASMALHYIDGDSKQYVDGSGNVYITGSVDLTVSVLKMDAKKRTFALLGWSKHG